MSSRPDDGHLRALMTDYQAGRLEAFEELYAQLAPSVRRFLASRPGLRVRAEDLTQDTFLQLHRARHTYDPAYPVMPWVLAVARNVWLMDRRSASRRPQWGDTELPEIPVPAEADGYADRMAVRQALRHVAPGRREAVVAHHVWGWSFREIAERAGVRETAAKLRSSRGVAQLRSLLRGGRPDSTTSHETRHDYLTLTPPDRLRAAIAADLRPLRPLPPPRRRALALLPAAVLLLLAAPTVFWLRPDAPLLGGWALWGLSAAQAAVGLGRLAPGSPRRSRAGSARPARLPA